MPVANTGPPDNADGTKDSYFPMHVGRDVGSREEDGAKGEEKGGKGEGEGGKKGDARKSLRIVKLRNMETRNSR